MAVTPTVTVLEHAPVSPPPGAAAQITLPLTFLDVVWLQMPPVHRLLFYPHPLSKTEFVDKVMPHMKNSLSETLQHFSPLAGKAVVSPDHFNLSELRYSDGDAVPLVFAFSAEGFNPFASYSPRSCTDFHPLVPRLPPTSRAPDGHVVFPVFALQVTLFPDVGICIGVTNHHVVGDGNTIFRFMKAWAFFSSSNSLRCHDCSLPFYDRREVRDRKGLGAVFWDIVKRINMEERSGVDLLSQITGKVRSTFVVTREDIQRLKNHVKARQPEITHISSFTVVYSYVWVCLVRSRCEIYGKEDAEEMDHFIFPADCRAYLGVPDSYFGNCVVPCMGSVRTKELTGEEGLRKAAEAVGESIRSQLHNKDEDGVLRGAADWFPRIGSMKRDRIMGVAGSPKFDYYELEFGWGKATRFEFPSIDATGSISLSAASKKHGDGGLEVGLALPVLQMDCFTRIFEEGLKAL